MKGDANSSGGEASADHDDLHMLPASLGIVNIHLVATQVCPICGLELEHTRDSFESGRVRAKLVSVHLIVFFLQHNMSIVLRSCCQPSLSFIPGYHFAYSIGMNFIF